MSFHIEIGWDPDRNKICNNLCKNFALKLIRIVSSFRSMVRIPRQAKQKIVAFSAVPGEFSSDTDTDEVQTLVHRARVKMAEREISESGVVSAYQDVVMTSGRQVIMSPEGVWGDSKSILLLRPPWLWRRISTRTWPGSTDVNTRVGR